MMGKTRLTKELSAQLPTVYICLRAEGSDGYPLRTPVVLEWIQAGLKGVLGTNVMDQDDVWNDRDFYIPTIRFSLFLLVFLEQFHSYLEPQMMESFCFDYKHKDNFQWMWNFFTEPSEDVKPHLITFWKSVTRDADYRFHTI